MCPSLSIVSGDGHVSIISKMCVLILSVTRGWYVCPFRSFVYVSDQGMGMCPFRSFVYVSDQDMDKCVLLGPLFMLVTRIWTCVSF